MPPASVENTMTKWHAVNRALGLAAGRRMRGMMRRTNEVRRHNAPAYQAVYNHVNNAFNADFYNITQGGSNNQGVRVYFTMNPNQRRHITAAYNRLNNMKKEMAGVLQKVSAARTLQKRWRAARPRIMNKRKTTALLTLGRMPGVPNTRRALFNQACPRPVYGPKTELNALRMHNKYPTY